MSSLLPRGVSLASTSQEQLSPSEDMSMTLQKLLEEKACLEEKVEELEGDKRHFQNKLEEYIRYDREEREVGNEGDAQAKLERKISQLLAEKADLLSRLASKSEDTLGSVGSGQFQASHLSERDYLLQRLSELQTTLRLSQEQSGQQLEVLRHENSGLREETGQLRKALSQRHQYTAAADWRGGGHHRPPSWELAQPSRLQHEGGSGKEAYSSLPESLPSSSYSGSSALSGTSGSTGQFTGGKFTSGTESSSSTGANEVPISLSGLRLTSNLSPPPAPPTDVAAELKKVKRQLEKYKTVNIELDQKLKDAKLELRKYEERQTDSDVGYRMEVERLRSENSRLRAQLDRALSENGHLRSVVGRRY